MGAHLAYRNACFYVGLAVDFIGVVVKWPLFC